MALPCKNHKVCKYINKVLYDLYFRCLIECVMYHALGFYALKCFSTWQRPLNYINVHPLDFINDIVVKLTAKIYI